MFALYSYLLIRRENFLQEVRKRCFGGRDRYLQKWKKCEIGEREWQKVDKENRQYGKFSPDGLVAIVLSHFLQ